MNRHERRRRDAALAKFKRLPIEEQKRQAANAAKKLMELGQRGAIAATMRADVHPVCSTVDEVVGFERAFRSGAMTTWAKATRRALSDRVPEMASAIATAETGTVAWIAQVPFEVVDDEPPATM